MKRIQIFIRSTILVSMLILSLDAYLSEAVADCDVPSSAVSITVKQEGDKPVYAFTVTNNYDKPIKRINLGRSQKGMIPFTADELKPEKIVSPLWWKGETFYDSDEKLIMYTWEPYAKAHLIQKGESVSGFKLVMPKPIDMMKEIPFLVWFRESGIEYCSYGTVVEE